MSQQPSPSLCWVGQVFGFIGNECVLTFSFGDKTVTKLSGCLHDSASLYFLQKFTTVPGCHFRAAHNPNASESRKKWRPSAHTNLRLSL